MEDVFKYFDHILLTGFLVVYFCISVPLLAGLWLIFEKSGRNGALSIIPIYNAVVWLQVARRPVWWLLLLPLPVLGWFVLPFWVWRPIVAKFGKSWPTALGLSLLPLLFIPIVGFGKNTPQKTTDLQEEIASENKSSL